MLCNFRKYFNLLTYFVESPLDREKLLRFNILRIRYTYHTTQNCQNKWTKISGLETNIFGLKMMVRSGLEFFISKFYQPLQSCCCPVQKKLPRKAELAWQLSKYLMLDHFSPSFLTQKCWIQDLRFQYTYFVSSRWCGDLRPT